MKMSKPKITACVIAFNEERDIAECLASLTWCDEVIVVDSGSTDRTVAIAQDFGARIIVRPFEGFSAQKNFAADQARNDWILSVDADEILTPELRDELATTVASTSASGFYIPRLNLWLNQPIRHAGWYPDYTLRLYRRSAGKWVGHSHERVVVDGDTRILRSPIVHKTIATMHDHLRKGLLSSVLELKEAKANGLRFYWFPPGSVLKQIINDVKKGPFSLLTFRMAYKQHLKNRVDFVWLLPFHPFCASSTCMWFGSGSWTARRGFGSPTHRP